MVQFIRNLKLTKKLLIAPLISLLFLMGLSYLSYRGFGRQQGAMDDIFNSRFKAYQNSSTIINALKDVHTGIYKALSLTSAGTDLKQVEDLGRVQLAATDQIKGFIESILKTDAMTPEEREIYESSVGQIEEYRAAIARVIDMVSSNLSIATMMMKPANDKFQVLNGNLSGLLELENRLSREKYDSSVETSRALLRVFVTVLIAALVLCLLLTFLMARLITSPIKGAMNVIQKIAQGDLTQDITAFSKDEVGELTRSVNTMRINMREAVGQSIITSRSLSESSSQQAASLEETSSSLEEMSSMIRQNADHTGQADHLMTSAKARVQEVNTYMNELNASMSAIAGASEQTQKIVKTIDEIAFQTNLLALNAAVEAARAGDAGAGFAVVADEVRNLALRAAQAAKNTSGLVEDIGQKIKDGEKLVSVTGRSFDQVRSSSEKVVDLMGQIAAASLEQSQGIDQISRAITEMNRTTQQNAASAETLASVMGMFKTETDGAHRFNGSGGKARSANLPSEMAGQRQQPHHASLR
jgi:methyl-accepting chemotaxis protein